MKPEGRAVELIGCQKNATDFEVRAIGCAQRGAEPTSDIVRLCAPSWLHWVQWLFGLRQFLRLGFGSFTPYETERHWVVQRLTMIGWEDDLGYTSGSYDTPMLGRHYVTVDSHYGLMRKVRDLWPRFTILYCSRCDLGIPLKNDWEGRRAQEHVKKFHEGVEQARAANTREK